MVKIINESFNSDLNEHIFKSENLKLLSADFLTKCVFSDDYCSLSDLQIGDIVEISYLPYSQKYLDYYQEKKFIGKVFYLNDDKSDALIYFDEQRGRIIKSVYADGCSYGFSNDLGYDLYIKKCITHSFGNI